MMPVVRWMAFLLGIQATLFRALMQRHLHHAKVLHTLRA
jgi:hypothetical protein